MKTEFKLYTALGLLVLLGIAVYFVLGQEDTHAQSPSGTPAQDLPVIKLSKEDSEKVTKFVIKNADKGEVTLEKKDDKWEITKPISARANEQHIKSVVENLQKLELSATIGDNAAIHEKYELTDEKGVHVQAFAGDSKVLDMIFGKSGGRGQMARMGDGSNPTVYACKGYSSFAWAKDVKTWRFNEILTLEDKNVVSVEVENEHGKFSFTKADDKWSGKFYERDKEGKLAEKPADIERFDDAKVNNMLSSFKNLKATNFAEQGDDTGLDDPLKHGGGVVRINMKDDAAKYVLKIGKKQEGSNRYLEKEGDPTIYVITSYTADWGTSKVDKFQKSEKKDAAAEEGEGEGDGADEDADADADKDAKEDKDEKGEKKDDKGKGEKKDDKGKGEKKEDKPKGEKKEDKPAPKPAPAPAPAPK